MNKAFAIRNTRKYGKGVFAVLHIPRGAIIHRFSGETVSARALIDRINSGKENIDDPLQVGMRTYLDLDTVSRTFNHSCNPNAALRKRSELFAIRDIRAGEEITYDYSLTIAPTSWSMRCSCGAPSCRGTLGDVLTIPKTIRTRYRKLGAMQNYMRRLLDSIGGGRRYRIPAYELASLQALTHTSNR